MKLSKYNFFVETGDDTVLLNTLSGAFYNICEKNDSILPVLRAEEPVHSLSPDILTELAEGNCIIEDSVDESISLSSLIRETISGTGNLNLIIMPTEKCNFNCIYCYENHDNSLMSTETQSELLLFIDEHLIRAKTLNIDWFGGEPTIASDIIESITHSVKKLCQKHNVSFVASMTTNGYLLDLALLKRFKRLNICSYQITLDGFASTHDKQRLLKDGSRTWNKIINNLQQIRDSYKSAMLKISIRVNLSREIYNNYKDFIDFLSDEFGHDKRFSFLIRLVSDYGNINDDVKEVFCTKEEYFEVLLYSLKKGMENSFLANTITPGGMLCYAFKNNYFVVQSNGIISKCTLNLYNDFNTIGTLKYGISQNSDIFDSGISRVNSKCQNCVKYPICLKADCNIMTGGEMECEIDMVYLGQILEYLRTDVYNCKTIK